MFFFFFQAEDGIRDYKVTGVQTCALPISSILTCSPRPEAQKLDDDAVPCRHPNRGALAAGADGQPLEPGDRVAGGYRTDWWRGLPPIRIRADSVGRRGPHSAPWR